MTSPENVERRESGKPKCGARKRQGEGFCGRPAGWGTDHVGVGRCKLHGGNTGAQRKRAQRQMAAAALVKLGRPVAVDPQQALLEQVWEAAGNVEFYRLWAQQLVDPVDAPTLDEVSSDELAGDVVPTAGRGRFYGRIKIDSLEARAHIVVELYNAERDRLAKVAKLAIDAGIAERHVQMAEQQAELVARVFAMVLDDPELGLDRGQREVGRRIAGRQLRLLAGGQSA